MYNGRRGNPDRSGGTNTLLDLLDALKTEIETTQHDLSIHKIKCADYESKSTSPLRV